MRILGLDPGLANLGWAVLDFEAARPPRLIAAGVLRTSPGRKLTMSESNGARCADIGSDLAGIMDDCQPWIMATEAQSWTRRHKADVQVAQAFGVIFALAGVDQCPIVHLPPKEVKQRATGRKSASKADVQAALADRLVDYEATVGQIPKSHRDHAADAAAVALAAHDTDLALALRRLPKNGRKPSR